MAHEDLSRAQHVESSSNRAFGFVFAGMLLVLALWPVFHSGSPRWWAFGGFGVVALIALMRPTLLAGLNRLWTRFGLLLGAIVSPIALGILFYGVLTPLGMLSRLKGNDPLRLKRDISARSYWIPREPPGPPPDSMINQF